MGKRQEAAAETRRKLVEATKQLLSEKKADEINIEDITTTAGVAKGTFYVYFKRKEDAVCEITYEEYNNAKLTAEITGKSIEERIAIYLVRSAELIEKGSLQMAQQWMKAVVAPLDGEVAGLNKYNFDCDKIKELLTTVIENGEVSADCNADDITDEILCEYYGAVAVWCITNGEKSLSERIEQYCNTSLSAILNQYKN